MSKSPRINLIGTQLAFPLLSPKNYPTLSEVEFEHESHQVLRRFSKHLKRKFGHSDRRIESLSGHLMSMVRSSKANTPQDLLDPELSIELIRIPKTENSRINRLTALHFLLQSLGTDQEQEDRWLETIYSNFAGRSIPKEQYVDVSLGGTKNVQKRPPLILWANIDAMFGRIMDIASKRTRIRDLCLLALHVRSSLKTEEISRLMWDQLDLLSPAREVDSELWHFQFRGEKSQREIVLHDSAFRALMSHWRSEGQPISGPVFRTVQHSHITPLTPSRIGQVLRELQKDLRMPPWDRRRLRHGFAAWLRRTQGWSDYVVKQRFGVASTQLVRQMIEPIEEMLAQIEVNEVIVVDPVGTDVELVAPLKDVEVVELGGGGSKFLQVST